MSAPRLTIPQPCAESWAAMTPTAAGRHCAACQKTVVDFTRKTDAEILVYLANAARGRTCGRFAAGQLDRPLPRATPAAPTGRWRAWLAAAVAVWAVRAGSGNEVQAQAATEWRARYWGGPMPAAPLPNALAPNALVPDAPVPVAPVRAGAAATPALAASDTGRATVTIRGVVRDSAAHLGLPGVTVLVKNTQIGVSTDADGAFELAVPTQYVADSRIEIQLSSVGYVTQRQIMAVGSPAAANCFYLAADTHTLGEMIYVMSKMPPAPWYPRAFYYWGKYWLTRPFRRQ